MPPHASKKRKTTAATAVNGRDVEKSPPSSPSPSPSPSSSSSSSSSADREEEDSTGGVDLEVQLSSGEENEEDEYPFSEGFGGSEGSDSDSDNLSDLLRPSTKKRKRNNPAAFSTTMSKILSSHLTTKSRADPVLVRAKHTGAEVDEGKLEAKARRALRDEKRRELEKGRIRELVPAGTGEAGAALEMERRLRKTAQRGVVKLFNAVRTAQIKGEESARVVTREGVVGIAQREEKVTEMSKQGFLSLIQSGGK